MDITMDKADYSKTEDWYYAALIGTVTHTIFGVEYTFETTEELKIPSSIWENTVDFTTGFRVFAAPV